MKILFKNNTVNSSHKNFLDQYILKPNLLKDITTKEIINAMNSISNYWISNRCGVRHIIKEYEIGFIALWSKKSNLEKLLKLNFNHYNSLDEPVKEKIFSSTIYGRPLGLAVHWVAGNIPLLSIISLFQTLLTKNRSIVKVPKNLKNILPEILFDLKKNKSFPVKTKKIINILLESTLVIYYEKDDFKTQEKLSKSADIRIVWGGLEAVENIIGLKKKINCRDIIFGPKISLAYVSKDKIKSMSNIKKLSSNLVNDVLPFNQAGCNSPHNLIIEKATKKDLIKIAEALAREFNLRSKEFYLDNPVDKYNIIEKKFIFQSKKRGFVLSGKNNQWNIFINTSKKITIENPIFCRSIFLISINRLSVLKKILPSNTQSMGIFTSDKKKQNIIKFFADLGIDRFPSLGKMSIYENPWDGYLPLQQMVKWISSN